MNNRLVLALLLVVSGIASLVAGGRQEVPAPAETASGALSGTITLTVPGQRILP